MEPFLMWTGGKRWLIQSYPSFLPKRINGVYIEPFCGSGTIFFSVAPQRAILSDLNLELIVTYRAIRQDYSKVVRRLEQHSKLHSKDYYYKVRSIQPIDIFDVAARFIYLNRTCFNGIYRVNQQGLFNVPIGSKTSVLRSEDNWAEWSQALSRAELACSDFEEQIDLAGKGDFLFVDPPYTVRHNYNGFIKYNEKLFSWADQERLAAAVDRARRRGARVLVTNANHQSVHMLYGRGFQKQVASRRSSIAADSSKRAKYEELIITAN